MRKSIKKHLSLLLLVTFIFTLNMGIGRKDVKAKELDTKEQIKKAMKEKLQKELREEAEEFSNKDINVKENLEGKDPEEIVRVIVQMEQQPVVKSKLADAKAVEKVQQQVKLAAEKLDGAKIKQSYTYVVNGFSMEIKRSEIDKLREMPGVKSVREARVYYPTMTSAKEITQAYKVWQDLGYKGEGMVVSIVDTGIDVNHKDMKLTDPSKRKIKDIKQGFTQKVPYGRNFADGNEDVKDAPGKNMHGMHVAGIVGANGNDDEITKLQAIKGVAPEAQLLAMKVFSNNPAAKGAYDDDIIAAIEDSVLHGADVINMSLGGPAGFQDPEDVVEVAIRNATDKGTLVVIAAGNDANSATSSGWNTPPTNEYGIVDAAMVGAPGTAKDALTVASYENNNLTGDALTYEVAGKTNKMFFVPSETHPATVLKDKYDLVDCGLGGSEDYTGKDVQGKIAIVKFQDGGSSRTLRTTAKIKGAAGLIIYSKDGDETVSGMAAVPTLVPAAWVGNSNGKKLIEGIAKGLKVSFDGSLTVEENPSKADMSPFTSFGPTPNLAMKPEISAPGGSIYSTVNDNQYGVKSGTSMATPHVAGSEALIMQGVKAKDLGLSGRQLVEFAKKTAINTSKPQIDKYYGKGKVPYSPRRQGAGLIQIKDAIENKVIVTDKNNEAVVALKEIGQNTKFTLNLKNYSKESLKFKVDAGSVLFEYTMLDKKGHFADYEMPGSDISVNKKTITLAPKSETTLEATIKLPSEFKTDNFVEGYIKLISLDGKNPNLSVPYMGFYGDWSKPTIIDAPRWEKNSIVGMTGLTWGVRFGIPLYLGIDTGNDGKLFVNKDKIAISPNGDGDFDEVTPCLAVLRNIKNMKVQIVQKNGDEEILVTTLDDRSNIGRPDKESKGSTMAADTAKWNGRVYNPATGKYEAVKDGQYYYKISTKVDLDNAKEQNLYMPVKIDTVEPEVKIVSSEIDKDNVCTLKWNQKDNGENASGVKRNSIFINNSKVENFEEPITEGADGIMSCKFKVQPNQFSQIAVGAVDFALNLGVDIVNYGSGMIIDNLEEGTVLNKKSLNEDGTYTIMGYTSNEVDKVIVNGKEAKMTKEKLFMVSIPLTEGKNDISLIAKNNKGEEIKEFAKNFKIIVDTTAPIITITEPKYTEGEGIALNDYNLTIKGTVKDNITDPQDIALTVKNGKVKVNPDGTFEAKVKVFGNSQILIEAKDLAENVSSKTISAGYESLLGFTVKFNNLKTLTIVSPDTSEDVKDDVYTIKGSVNKKPEKFTINGEEVKINPDLTFNFDMKLKQPYNKVVVYAEEKGKVIYNYAYNIWYDGKAPKISIEEPIENADGKVYTNQDKVRFKGTVEDNTLGYSLYINGNNVLTIDKYPGHGEDRTRRTFDYEMDVVNGLKAKLECIDEFGNYVSKDFDIVVDKVAPSLSIAGVEDGKIYNKAVSPTINCNEGDAAILATLNGKEYDGKAIEQEGEYELEVIAVDLAGNKSEKQIVKFSIDKTAPAVTVTGVENDKAYNAPVTPVVNVDDKEATVTTTLNGKAYDGKEISEEGSYELIVTAVDKAENKTEVKVNFTIDKTTPEVTVKGAEDGKVYDKEVTPEITVDDKDATLRVMLNGKEYDGKNAIKEEGKYKLEIVVTDKAGNAKKITIEFEIKHPSKGKDEEKPADNQKPGNDQKTTDNQKTTTNNVNNNNNETKTTTGKLTKTGSLVNGNLLMSLGATLMGLGAAFVAYNKRKTIK